MSLETKISQAFQAVGTDVGGRTIRQSAGITVTVGSGGDFSTINAAIAHLSKRKMEYVSRGINATVRLLTGFVMAEQVLVDRIDLGWITVISDAAVVNVTDASITQFLGDDKDLVIPLFGASNGGVSPVVGALFAYGSPSTAKDGVGATYGGRVRLLAACGVQNARQAVVAFYGGSHIECTPTGIVRGDLGSGALGVKGADFRNAYTNAIYAAHGATVDLPRSNFNDCTCGSGGQAVFGIWGATINIYQAEVKRSTGRAILVRDGARCLARETDVSNAAVHGYQAYHGGYIDARYVSTSPAGSGGCSGAGSYGCAADGASIIEADTMNAQNCGQSFRAENGSIINASASDCRNSGTAVYAEKAATVNARDSLMSGCTGVAIRAGDASTVSVHGSDISGCTHTGSEGAVWSGSGSMVNVRDCNISNASGRAVTAIEGGRVVADRANVSNCGNVPFTSERGSHISARAATTTGNTGTVFQVFNGGMLNANSASGNGNQSNNAVTGNGIIFR